MMILCDHPTRIYNGIPAVDNLSTLSGADPKPYMVQKHICTCKMITTSDIPELSKLLVFLGNEQRLRILKSIADEEKYAREISEELSISRTLVNIYLKQLERMGLVTGTSRVTDDPPLMRRYYRAVPFELVVSLDTIKKMEE
ncbi:MAG: winged helix-turn-helix domain-containing protein [Methanoculleus sp.]|nr:winged helix-turn-helix domain-containing protein [Methanoculleus sp.]